MLDLRTKTPAAGDASQTQGPRPYAKSVAFVSLTALLLVAAACGPKTTTEEAGPAGTRLGGLGKAAANLPPEEESTTTSEETTTTSEAPPASDTAPSTATTEAPVTTPVPTRPPPSQATVTTRTITQQQPPQNDGPSESPPKLSAKMKDGSIQCPGNKVTIEWTGANLSSVTVSLNGSQVASGGGSGSATVSYACGTQARYNLAGSNSAGSATAYVDVYHS